MRVSAWRHRSAHWIMREAIRGYVEREEKREAIKTIRTGVKILARQPDVGRPVEDMNPEFLEWAIDFGSSGYIALYRFDGKTGAILEVR